MASSSIYYKFKSQREPSRIAFDGTAISVWDIKREIILQNKMGKGIDFDLGLYNPDTEEGVLQRLEKLSRDVLADPDAVVLQCYRVQRR